MISSYAILEEKPSRCIFFRVVKTAGLCLVFYQKLSKTKRGAYFKNNISDFFDKFL